MCGKKTQMVCGECGEFYGCGNGEVCSSCSQFDSCSFRQLSPHLRGLTSIKTCPNCLGLIQTQSLAKPKTAGIQAALALSPA